MPIRSTGAGYNRADAITIRYILNADCFPAAAGGEPDEVAATAAEQSSLSPADIVFAAARPVRAVIISIALALLIACI